MKKHFTNRLHPVRIFWLLIVFQIFYTCLNAQEEPNSGNGKALNIPFRKFGLSIGNSKNFSGLRLNFIDEDVQRINGLNLTGWTRDYGATEVVNGVNIGIIPSAKLSNALTIGLYGTGGEKINGLVYGTVAVGSRSINGISIAGFVNSSAGNISGISVAGIGIFTYKSINGLAISVGYIQGRNEVRGFPVTVGYLNTSALKGVAISGYSRSERMYGLSISIFNRTKELHGLQIGLLNHAANNPRGLRMLPILNFHL